jgi:predicted nucleic acid-binding protein
MYKRILDTEVLIGGDCLIKAIAKRLHAAVITRDRDFRARIPPR